jgi:hypothetical protein
MAEDHSLCWHEERIPGSDVDVEYLVAKVGL